MLAVSNHQAADIEEDHKDEWVVRVAHAGREGRVRLVVSRDEWVAVAAEDSQMDVSGRAAPPVAPETAVAFAPWFECVNRGLGLSRFAKRCFGRVLVLHISLFHAQEIRFQCRGRRSGLLTLSICSKSHHH